MMLDIVGTSAGDILALDDTNNNVLAAVNGTIETRDMDFDDERGGADRMKKVSEVIPHLILQDLVCEIFVQVGLRNRLSDDIEWSDPVPFTLGVSDKVDFDFYRKQGKFVRLRFFTDQTDTAWSLSGFSVKFEQGGYR